jgi:hypothetical protein
MPIVPVVDQNMNSTPAVQAPSVSPMQDYSAEQTQRTGATIQRAGEQALRTGQHIQEQLDDANVKAAESKFIETATDVLHGDNGYMNKLGADAINGYDSAAEALVKAKKELNDSLGNDVQKLMFNRVTQQHLVTLGDQMHQHRAIQRREYSAAQSAARADSMRAMAQVAEIGSADQNKFVETGVRAALEALSFRGIPADSDEAKKAERLFRSQITQDNVSRLMEDGKYTEASALLNEQMKSGNVEADTGDRLRRAIRANEQRTQNIETTDKLFAPLQNKDLRATDLEDVLQKAEAIKNPEQREQVQSMLKAKFAEQHSIQQQKYRDNLNDVVNELASNGGNVRKVDPVKWGMLQPKDQADLMPKPKPPETDLNTWYGFVTKPDSLTQNNVNEAFAKGLLSKADFKNFTELVQKKASKPEYVQEASGINERIDYFANQAGLVVYGTQGPEDKIKHGQLTYAVQNEIDRIKAQNKGKITSEQVDQVIKKELTQRTLNELRSPWNPARIFGNTYSTSQRFNFELPPGATHVVPGSDGKMHYTDGTSDLGVVK